MSVRGTDRREYINIRARAEFRGGGGSAFQNPQSHAPPSVSPDRLGESASRTRGFRPGRTEAIKRKSKRHQWVSRYDRAAVRIWYASGAPRVRREPRAAPWLRRERGERNAYITASSTASLPSPSKKEPRHRSSKSPDQRPTSMADSLRSSRR